MLKILNRKRKILAFILELSGIALVSISLVYDLLFEYNSDLGFGLVQKAGAGIGLVISLSAEWIYREGSFWRRAVTIKLPSLILFCIGAVLIGVNLVGNLVPLRNPAVYGTFSYAGKDRSAVYTAEEVYAQMDRDHEIDPTRKDYAQRLTRLIHDGTIHIWEADTANDFRTEIPIYENYLIFLIKRMEGGDQKYEFCAAERAIERCASVCSQSSKILADILIANNIPVHIVALDGHVVVRVKVEKKPSNQWWILDGDYGVVIEHDLAEIESDPELARAAYLASGYSETIADRLGEIYGPEGNAIIDKGFTCTREDNLYSLIWIIPVISLLPFTLYCLLELIVFLVKNAKK